MTTTRRKRKNAGETENDYWRYEKKRARKSGFIDLQWDRQPVVGDEHLHLGQFFSGLLHDGFSVAV